MLIENIEQILERRKGIERDLVDMSKEIESDFTSEHIRDAIFNEPIFQQQGGLN